MNRRLAVALLGIWRRLRRSLQCALRQRWRVVCLLVAAPVVVIVGILAWPMQSGEYLRARPSGEMQDRSGQLLHAFINGREQWCFERDIREISPRLIQATLAAEDQRFYRHFGVDLVAVARALWQNLRGRRVVSGASTLTMQLVKARRQPDRGLWGKITQAFRALRLDVRAGKSKVLRAYLNNMPYGLNLVGVEAASWRYFGKPSIELTLPEAALLAGLPKAPTAFMPLRSVSRAVRRRNYVLRRMEEEGYITSAQLDAALAAPPGTAWHDLPALSPHLAMRLRPVIKARTRVRTTLDLDVQRRSDEVVRRRVGRSHGEIGNAAVFVVDTTSRNILARIGSASFFGTPGGGQVDAARANRSPGSALKPFIYALAMERNCLYASEMLLDAPADYGLYSPENFDRIYRGLTPADLALRNSLNMPALTVLQRVGVDETYAFFERLGLGNLKRPADQYGLGLALGNCDVQLEQLVTAYCMVANLGVRERLNVLADVRPTSGTASVRLLSRGVCMALYQMLRQPLPDDPSPDRVRPQIDATPVCWKTGTSTGYHDAWAVVFNCQYVVGVWMGNNDGRASPQLVGIRSALPLAAEIFRSLPPQDEPAWPDTVQDLHAVATCAVSGLPASKCCPRSVETLLPKCQYLHRTCAAHAVGATAMGDLVSTRSTPATNGERWPATIREWDLADIRNLGREKSSPQSEKSVRIINPPQGAEFILTGEANGDRVMLKSSIDERSNVHWYVDDLYAGESQPFKPVSVRLKAGKHRLSCMSPDGITDQVEFQVLQRQTAEPFKGN